MIVFQKKKRSERQVQMLKFINGFIEEHHYPPTVRDIQFGCNISSTSVVDYNLRILHRDGLLRREAEVSRGIEVINQKKPEDGIEVPILGRIAAGEPLKFNGINSIGLRRKKFDIKERKIIKEAYKILYKMGLNVTQAINKIKNDLPETSEIINILQFLDKSNRGIIS